MKHLIFLLVLFSSPLFASFEMSEEFNQLSHLIDVTRENLKDEEELLKLLQQYVNAREDFMGDAENRRKAHHLVNLASNFKDKLLKCHLEPLFSTRFLEEIETFSNLKKKRA